MLVTRCPKCGKPTPANLSTPDAISCSACGYAGEPSDEARPVLKAARAHLDAQDVRRRQIAESSRRALERSDALVFVIVFAVASIPCTAVFLGVVQRLMNPTGPHPSPAAAVTSFVAFAVMWALGIGGFLLVRRAQVKLRAACGAVPPARSGEPSRCRVCGGDLPAGGAFVRCRFCGADNWSDVGSIRSIERRESADASDYEGALAREVAYTAALSSGQRKLAPVFAIVIPIGFLILLDQITPLLQRIETKLDDSIRYTTAMTRDGECVGHPILDEHGSYVFEFGVRTEFPGNLGKSAPPLFSASDLVGKEVRAYLDATTPELEGRVERVTGSPVGNLAIVTEGGKSTRVDVRALCAKTPKIDLLLKDVPTFTIQGDDMFWPESGRIDHAKLEETKVATLGEVDGVVTAIASSTSDVFYSTGRDLYAAPIRGGVTRHVAKLGEKEWVLQLSASTRGDVVCGTATPYGAIVFFSGEKEPIRVPFTFLSHVLARESDVFVTGALDGQDGAFRIAKNGKVERVVSGFCHSIAADDEAVYCGLDHAIVRAALASGAARTIFELPVPWPESKNESIAAIALDGTDVYFSFEGKIGRVAKTGGIAHVVMDELPELGPELFVKSESIYVDMHRDRKFGGGEVVSFPRAFPR